MVEVNRSVPGPETSMAVLVVLTTRLSVPDDSTDAPAAAMFSGLLADKLVVGKPRIPAFTVVVPE